MLATTTSSVDRGEDLAEAVDEQFWALVRAADEEVVNAQFEAIIAAEWPIPPGRPSRRAADRRGPGAPVHQRTHPVRPPARSAHPGIDGGSRQRSPPARTK